MSYGKVHEEYWEGEKIEPLSDSATLLGVFLITGPHRNAIGCFKLGIGAITDVPRFGRWGIEGVSKAIREMIDTGFIVRDERTGWTFITNALTKDPIKGAKAAIHAAKLAAAVPVNSVVYTALKAALEPQLMVEEKALSKADGWPMRCPIDGVSIPKPSPSPLPEPIPEPEPQPQPAAAAVREPACDFIELFDEVRAETFGAEQARPWPNAQDLGTARRWLESGVDLGMARGVFRTKMAEMLGKGRSPPQTLSYFDQPIANALAASKQPMPKGNPDDDPLAIPAFLKRGGQPTKTDRAKAAVMRAAVAGGYAPTGSGGEAGVGDDPVPVLPVAEALRQGTGSP